MCKLIISAGKQTHMHKEKQENTCTDIHNPNFTCTMLKIDIVHFICVHVCCCGHSLAVFVGWFVVVDWNSRLIFALHQVVTILSHELKTHNHTHIPETEHSRINDVLAHWLTVLQLKCARQENYSAGIKNKS